MYRRNPDFNLMVLMFLAIANLITSLFLGFMIFKNDQIQASEIIIQNDYCGEYLLDYEPVNTAPSSATENTIELNGEETPQGSPTIFSVGLGELENLEQLEQTKFQLYDIPLSEELQKYAYDLCKERGIEFEVFLALIQIESNFNENDISAGGDYGLCQTNKINHRWLKDELGITDFLDGHQSINAGTYMLGELIAKHGDVNMALMSYNFGSGRASELWSEGITSSKYSRRVLDIANLIKEGDLY